MSKNALNYNSGSGICFVMDLRHTFIVFLEAQLLCKYIDPQAHSLTSTLSTLLVDHFWRFYTVCHLKFDKDAISDSCRGVKLHGIGRGF